MTYIGANNHVAINTAQLEALKAADGYAVLMGFKGLECDWGGGTAFPVRSIVPGTYWTGAVHVMSRHGGYIESVILNPRDKPEFIRQRLIAVIDTAPLVPLPPESKWR